MINNKKFSAVFSLFFLILPLFPIYAGLVPCGLSQDDPDQAGDQTVPCQFCHLFVLFNNVMKFLLIRIVPILAVLMIAIGGFMYIFAYISGDTGSGGGQPPLISQAKKLFASVAIGLLIIYSAWFFVNLFFQILGVADWIGFTKGGWKIDCPGF